MEIDAVPLASTWYPDDEMVDADSIVEDTSGNQIVPYDIAANF